MNKLILCFIAAFLISLNISLSWWDASWRFCKDITIDEAAGISRWNEPVEIFINSSEWEAKPNKNSIRIINSDCSSTGEEVEYGMWNETFYGNNTLEFFNIVFEVNATENSRNKFSIYYDSEDKPQVNYSGIELQDYYYSWRARTRDYDMIYSQGDYAGFKIFKYTAYGDEETNYPGNFAGGQLAIMDIGPRQSFSWIYNTPTCVKYRRYDLEGSVVCRVCYKSNILSCENEGKNKTKGTVATLRDLFYDPINPEDLYYRTNEEDEIKRSNLTIHQAQRYEFRFGAANSTKGTNIVSAMTNGSSSWNATALWLMVYNPTNKEDNYGALPSFNPIDWKTIWFAITNETLEKAYERAANWSIAIDHPLENYVNIKEREELEIEMQFPSHVFINEANKISAVVYYNKIAINNLTQNNFELYLDGTNIQQKEFYNLNNGSYAFDVKLSSQNIGSHKLKIKVNYNNKPSESEKEIILLIHPKNKPLIITDGNWKNYISAASTGYPVLVYKSSRKLIDQFIDEYNPDQIFQLGTTLTFLKENYFADSSETLVKIFFTQSDLIIPSNKEIALKSSFMDLPMLFGPSQKTIEYLKPNVIHNFTSLQQADDLFKEKNPNPDYFVLTNPEEENSIFSFSAAKNKNAFVAISSGDEHQSKNELIKKITRFNLPQSYYFDGRIYLLLIDAPYFSIADPTAPKTIISDTPYCDVNGDGYQDLSCGRLLGNQESLSYQIEYSKLFKPDKTALILASYNTPGRYWDVLIAGGTMPTVLDIELELLEKNFNVKRLVEKRSEFDELNFTVVKKLNEIIEKIGSLEETSYVSLFSSLLGDITKIVLIAKAGDTALYSFYEFDWGDSWKSLLDLKPKYPKHLPIFNEANLRDEAKKNQAVIYLSKGNETHWLIPINSSWHSTLYDEFDPSNLGNKPLFYYLKYSNSFGIRDKILGLGALSIVSSTSDSYNIYSDRTAHYFFKYFDQPVGKALIEARNRNYELSQIMKNKNIYEKEYYDTILLGDPSISFDPNLHLEQSVNIKEENGNFAAEYSFDPSYKIIDYDSNSYIIFEDADDYFVDENKPIIPIYKKEFMLPADSELLGFSIKLSNKTYDNIELPIIPSDPDHFTNETFNGMFPEENYWNLEARLLDNRTIFTGLFSPIVYYSNNTAKIFERINISLKYKSPLEILEISAKDIKQGESEKIDLNLFSNLNQNKEAEIILKIQTDGFENISARKAEIKPGGNRIQLIFENTTSTGNYSVSILAVSDGAVIGPKYTYFKVVKRSFFKEILYPIYKLFKINPAGFLNQEKSFKEKYTAKKIGDKTILDYVSLNITIHIEQTPEKTTSQIKTKEGDLAIEQSSLSTKYTLNTSEGSLLIIKEKGQIKKDVFGNEAHLRKVLDDIMEAYKNKLEELNLTS